MEKISIHIRLLGLLTLLAVSFGCSSFERSKQSGYSDRSTQSTKSGWEKQDHNNDSTPPKVSQLTDAKIRLKQLESQLSSRRELEQYSRILPYFRSDEEKIEFLTNGTYEDRQAWLGAADLPGRIVKAKSDFQSVIDGQDIALGMPDTLVKKSWGDPKSMDVSGIPELRNQRWVYSKYVSTPDGYKTEQKIVYFEGGKVVGWETR